MMRITVSIGNFLVSILFLPASPLSAADIIVEWNKVTVPEAPALQSVTVDYSSTALLVLDIEERTCNQKRRPRCLDTVPGIGAFLKEARTKKIMVVCIQPLHRTGNTHYPDNWSWNKTKHDHNQLFQNFHRIR